MDPASFNVRMFVFPQRAKSGDATARLSIDETPSAPSGDMAAPAKKHNRSLSWLTSHRRKDSGVSVSTKSSKGLRISSPRPALTTRSDRSSFSSGLSRETNRLSVDSTRLLFALANDPGAAPESLAPLSSPTFPPKRPERPQEGLFDDLIETEGTQASDLARYTITREIDNGDIDGEDDADKAADDDSARALEKRVKRRSRELLGLAFEAVGAALPDVCSRSSCASPGPGSPAAPSIAPSHGHRRQHQKAFSESLAATPLARKLSARVACSPNPADPAQTAPASADAHHRSRTSRWTLTESMADMFRSPRSPKSYLRKDDKEHKMPKVVQKLVTEYPVIGDVLGHQPDVEVGPMRLEFPPRRPDGLPTSYHGSLGPRQRAIPFEIVIPPPPRSELFSHCPAAAELESPTFRQQRRSRELGETKSCAVEATAEDHVQNDGEALEHCPAPVPFSQSSARSLTGAPAMFQPSSTPESHRLRNRFLELEPRLKPPSSPHQRSRSLSQLGVETEERVYLKSTPFTLTNPAFRHGPITLQKSEMKTGPVVVESPEMDLAAFQSAIGGVGDLPEVHVEDDERRNSDDDESHIADEMAAWFEEFGFETHGELIPAEKPVERNLDRTSWDSACSMGSTLSMPLIIKTALSDSGEKRHHPVVVAGTHQQQRQRALDTIKQLGADDKATAVAAPSFYDFTVDYAKY